VGNIIRKTAGGIGGDIQYSMGGFWAKPPLPIGGVQVLGARKRILKSWGL